jgi:hypothetical protein
MLKIKVKFFHIYIYIFIKVEFFYILSKISIYFIEIYKWYHLQLTLCHAQILVAIFLQFTYIFLIKSIYNYKMRSPIDLLKYIPWPNIFLPIITLIMIKGVTNLNFFFFLKKKRKKIRN